MKNKSLREGAKSKKSEGDEILIEIHKAYSDTEWTKLFEEVCAKLDQEQQPDQSQE